MLGVQSSTQHFPHKSRKTTSAKLSRPPPLTPLRVRTTARNGQRGAGPTPFPQPLTLPNPQQAPLPSYPPIPAPTLHAARVRRGARDEDVEGAAAIALAIATATATATADLREAGDDGGGRDGVGGVGGAGGAGGMHLKFKC